MSGCSKNWPPVLAVIAALVLIGFLGGAASSEDTDIHPDTTLVVSIPPENTQISEGASAYSSSAALHPGAHSHDSHVELGEQLPLWSVIPFCAILLCIAMMPLAAPKFWHHHYHRVALGIATVFAVPFVAYFGHAAMHEILHVYLADYIPFIILLWALFTIAGGVVIKGRLRGTPAVNVLLLLIGTVLSSLVGTTGSSMLMVRPLLRANDWRKNKTHLVVFFIFLVSNVGGSLTPLGDPPLFLGFLHGVPFSWTLQLVPQMGTVAVILLIGFFFMDKRAMNKESPAALAKLQAGEPEPLGLDGSINLGLLGLVVAAVLVSGTVHIGDLNVLGIQLPGINIMRDIVLVTLGLVSLRKTPQKYRQANEFSWGPIAEVAYLFAGIFMTIIPALAILKAGEDGALAPLVRAAKEPAHYYWITGILSSFLDNAPTYLTFFNTALGRFYPGMPESQAVAKLLVEHATYLKAIACGAVFMGANSYIGNAPNFMVKAIAEQSGVEMPSFFGYILRWSLPILIPSFFVVMFIFFL